MNFFIVQPMLQLLALLITALSSFYLIWGVIKLSPAEIAKISSAHLDLDRNHEIGKTFSLQKADTVIGFSLLMVSLFVQMWSIGQPLRWIDVDGLTIAQTIITLVVFLFVAVFSESIRRALIRRYIRDVCQKLLK